MAPLMWSLGTLLVAAIAWRFIACRTPSPYSLKSVAGPKKEHWLTGNLHRLFKDGWNYHFDLLKEYGGVVKVYGMLGAEQLLVSDPRALHHIVVKEQDTYRETDMFVMTNRLIFGEGLISTSDEQHRKQRKMLNPVFSLANMRSLLPGVQPIADTILEQICAELPADGGVKEIDVHGWIAKGTLEYVARAVLGVSLETLNSASENAHADAIRGVAPAALSVIFLRPFVPMVVRNFSQYWRKKMVNWLPFPGLRKLRDISFVLDRSARKIYQEKKAELEEGSDDISMRRDLMTIMINANTTTSSKERLSEDELIGQINTMLLGGSTTTPALARILHVLSCEPDAQRRLRTELRKAKSDYSASHGIDNVDWQQVNLPYDALNALPYMDAIVRETLRVYPPTNMMNRTCTRDTVLPLQFPVRSTSGEETTSVHVPAGTNILISILGSNHNKEVWGDDASIWRPERWLTASGERIGFGKDMDMDLGDETLDKSVEGTPGCRNGVKYPGVYGTMMTFLGGGRACIGFKFAEMEIKHVLSTIIPVLHFAPPSAVDVNGVRKEIYWRMDGPQVPVVRPPHGDFKTTQVPLDVRLARETDFLSSQ